MSSVSPGHVDLRAQHPDLSPTPDALMRMVSTDRILADPDGTRTGPPRSHIAATQLIQRTHLIATQSRGKFRSVQIEEVRTWRALRSAISMTG